MFGARLLQESEYEYDRDLGPVKDFMYCAAAVLPPKATITVNSLLHKTHIKPIMRWCCWKIGGVCWPSGYQSQMLKRQTIKGREHVKELLSGMNQVSK